MDRAVAAVPPGRTSAVDHKCSGENEGLWHYERPMTWTEFMYAIF